MSWVVHVHRKIEGHCCLEFWGHHFCAGPFWYKKDAVKWAEMEVEREAGAKKYEFTVTQMIDPQGVSNYKCTVWRLKYIDGKPKWLDSSSSEL